MVRLMIRAAGAVLVVAGLPGWALFFLPAFSCVCVCWKI